VLEDEDPEVGRQGKTGGREEGTETHTQRAAAALVWKGGEGGWEGGRRSVGWEGWGRGRTAPTKGKSGGNVRTVQAGRLVLVVLVVSWTCVIACSSSSGLDTSAMPPVIITFEPLRLLP